MALVFRTDQNTPLTNDQVDNNFKYLRDQIDLKYSTSAFTAANISLKLRTTSVGQTSLQLAEANAVNAWTIRDLQPSSTLPVITNKSSVVARDSSGDITVSTVNGNLNGNAETATLATSANKLSTSRQINGVAFDGTANITIEDSTRLSLAGGSLNGKLNLSPATSARATVNVGVGNEPDSIAKVNGDVWSTSSGLFYHLQGQTNQIARVDSQTFTGVVQAPGYVQGIPSQVITLSHLENAIDTIESALALKANLASPTFTGTPTAPTASANTNNTTVSTTAFVNTAVNNKAGEITTAYQNYTTTAITNYNTIVNGLLNLKANLASPEFTGTPSAPTAAPGTNSNQLATTAFATVAINNIQNTLNSAVAALQDAINSTRPVPAASVFYIASTVVPYGYLECNGSWVLKDTYLDLWTALGSPALGSGSNANKFQLPDLRGEFIRGWDHGRGVDPNRSILSAQADEFKSHVHGIGSYPNLRGVGGGANLADGNAYLKDTFATGGTETRPRNIALMPIIKY